MKKPLPCLPTVLILFSTVFAHEEAGSNPAKSITRTELKDHVYFLASDEMAGRAITTDEFRTAALYCATQFQQAGLKPIKGDGDNTSFLQEVPFVKKTLGAAGMLMVENETTLHRFDATAETRYLMQADTRVFSQARPIVFAGYGICAPEHGWNDFDGLEIDGKIVVILAGAPRHGAPGILPADMFEKLNSTHPVMRWLRKYQHLQKLDAEPAAILMISDNIIDQGWDGIGGKYEGFKVFLEQDAAKPESEQNVMLISRNVAEALFEGQAYDPFASETADLQEYRTFELKDVKLKLDVGYRLDVFPSWNVIGMVQGSDPDLRDEYIVVGGHLDHVPPLKGRICNGADDNASGCAGVLEIAEAIALSPPGRSVLFCLWTGEEPLRGDACMGSKHFLDSPPIPLEKMKAYINLDMIGRTRPDNEKDRAHIVGSREELMPWVEELVRSVNEREVNWPIVFEVIASSDHMRFLDAGTPAFMFFSGRHGDLHRPGDDPEKIDYEKMEIVSQLAYWITLELAGSRTLRPTSSP